MTCFNLSSYLAVFLLFTNFFTKFLRIRDFYFKICLYKQLFPKTIQANHNSIMFTGPCVSCRCAHATIQTAYLARGFISSYLILSAFYFTTAHPLVSRYIAEIKFYITMMKTFLFYFISLIFLQKYLLHPPILMISSVYCQIMKVSCYDCMNLLVYGCLYAVSQ